MSEIAIGRVAGAFGLTGELKCDPTSAGRIVFSAGAELRCERAGASSNVRLASVRAHKNRLLIRLDGVNDANAAAAYNGALLYAARERVQLAPGEFFDDDLVGCAVYGADGTSYGEVERVEHYPASDMLIVNGRMIPMVGAIVTSIDLAGRRIAIDPPAGLLD